MSRRHRVPHHAADGGLNEWLRPANSRLWAVAAAAAVLAVLAAGVGGYRLVSDANCDRGIHLTITAAPEIAPAVRATAQTWVDTGPRVDGRCVAVQVTAANPADVAAAVAGAHKGALPGLGRAAGVVRVPEAWIPDSTTWLERLRAAGPRWVPGDAPSVARSPVVLAMPEPVAAALGWPARTPTLAALLPRLTGRSALQVGIVDPNRDAAGTSGLLALAAAARSAGPADSQQATVAALRSLGAGRSDLRSDLMARFPHAADATSVSSGLAAAPLSEQAVIAYNGTQPAVPLAALYPQPAAAPLDYPFAVMPGADRDQAEAARAVQVALSGNRYRDELARLGLRAPDDSTGAGFAAPRGAPTTVGPASTAQPDPTTLNRLLASWTALLAPGRMLTVIDISGSMATPVPTAGGATRDQVAVTAAKRGLTLLDDTWAVGLWTFSTKLSGGNDWQQLAPIGVLSSQRQVLANALTTIAPKVNGGTGLYNTVLAAYKAVQAGWDPGRVNSVLIMTDGKNEDAPGLSLGQLVAQLHSIANPARPVEIIALGIGNQVSEAELRTITSTTGGATFLAPDPSTIGEIFIEALGLRPNATK